VAIFYFPYSKYNTVTFLNSNDPICLYLKKPKVGALLLSPGIQSNNGMNAAFFSGASYYLMPHTPPHSDTELKSIYCYSPSYDYPKWVSSIKDCFEGRTRSEWMDIFSQFNIDSVMVLSSLKLNLELVAKNELFSIYK
jgi:hypothetical protein